ncbi:MAG: hypothetical protein V4629_12210 [Pseudomonadota bacterium]
MKMIFFRKYAALFLALIFTNSAQAAAVFHIHYLDSPGEGFYDTTPVTPVGTNTGTSLGQQRRIAMEYVADSLAQMLHSTVPIRVEVAFDSLGGDEFSASLAEAGPNTVHLNFNAAPKTNTYYAQALANQLSRMDLDPTRSDISAVFNSDIDGAALGSSRWYYGLDSQANNYDSDFISVATHELIHGLGFISLIDADTGAKIRCSGISDCLASGDDAYSLQLGFDCRRSSNCTQQLAESFSTTPDQLPLAFNTMSANQRKMASSENRSVVWMGEAMQAWLATNPILDGSLLGRSLMFSPETITPGSSLSHVDVSFSPYELMEPYYQEATQNVAVAAAALADMGWSTLTDLDLTVNSTTPRKWFITLENNGPNIANNVFLEILVPNELQLSIDEMTSDSACAAVAAVNNEKLWRCTWNNLGVGSRQDLIVILSNGASISNRFQVDIGAEITDPIPTNNRQIFPVNTEIPLEEKPLVTTTQQTSSSKSGGSTQVFWSILFLALGFLQMRNSIQKISSA